ncbi:MAG: hemerythrin domain-containing protein [Myxococcales bacterium]
MQTARTPEGSVQGRNGLTFPISRIALESSRASHLLDQWDMECAWGEDQSLRSASTTGGLADGRVLPMPSAATQSCEETPGEDHEWQHTTAEDLMEHLVETHHGRTRQALSQAERSFRGLDMVVFERLAALLLAHMRREETVVFPRIRAFERARDGRGPWPDPDGPSLPVLITEARGVHNRIVELLSDLGGKCSKLEDPSLAGVFESLNAGVRRQLHLESNGLFPIALGLEASA